jgi:hypothetical protein
MSLDPLRHESAEFAVSYGHAFPKWQFDASAGFYFCLGPAQQLDGCLNGSRFFRLALTGPISYFATLLGRAK